MKSGLLCSVTYNNHMHIYKKHEKRLMLLATNQDRDDISSMIFIEIKEVQSQKEHYYLVTGHKSCVKIWHLSENVLEPFLIQNNLKGPIDLLERNSKKPYLLIGSTVTKRIQSYELKYNKLELLNEIVIPSTEKLLNVYYIDQEGLVAACETKLYFYYVIGREVFSDQVIEIDQPISNFKLMYSHLDTNHYFVYTVREKLVVTQFIFDNSKMTVTSMKVNDDQKKKFIDEMNKCEMITLEESDTDTFTIKIKNVTLQISFKGISPYISIIEIPNADLNNKLRKDIEIFNKNQGDDPTQSSEKFIKEIAKVIIARNQSRPELNKESHKAIIPYIKTCGFTWGRNNKMLFYQYNKIDFKQLKQNDKVIVTYNNLENWVKFCENKDAKSKFTSSDNKLIDDENEPIGQIIPESLRKVSGWNLSFDSDINYFLKFINDYESLPKVFSYYENQQGGPMLKNTNMTSTSQLGVVYETPVKGQGDVYRKTSSTENQANFREMLFIHEVKNKEGLMKILPNLEIKLLSRESFYNSINVLLELMKDDETTVLVDILNHINFNINAILEQKSQLLIEFYKKNIFTLVQTLEIRKKYEYLFICLIVIASRIFYDITSAFIFKQDLSQEEKKRTSSIYFKNSYSNLNLKQSLNSLHSDNFNGRRKVSMGTTIVDGGSMKIRSPIHKGLNTSKDSQQDFILISDSNNNIKDNDYGDVNSDYEGVSLDEAASFDHKKNQENLDLSLHFSSGPAHDNFDVSKETSRAISSDVNTHQQLTNLLKIFGEEAIDIILRYLYFISNHLHQMDRVNESAEMLKFLSIVSKKFDNKCRLKEIEVICSNGGNNNEGIIDKKNREKEMGKEKEKEKEKDIRKETDQPVISISCFKMNEITNKEAVCVFCMERIRKGILSVMSSHSGCTHFAQIKEIMKSSVGKSSFHVLRKRNRSFNLPPKTKKSI